MADVIIMGHTLMYIGNNDPMRAEELFREAGGEVKETKENGIKYIVIKDKLEKNESDNRGT